MWRGAVVAVAACALAAGAAVAQDGKTEDGADAIVGVWETAHTDNGWAHIEMSRRGDAYFGKIVWINETLYPEDDEMAGQTKVDRENPDPKLQDRPIVGLEIVKGLEYAGDAHWEGGTIYDPESGKTYKSKAQLADGGDTLALRGYIGFSLLGRTSHWQRLE
jgi:uncharacterized protein (DUF2147 family)